jgi:uncharacterized protein YwqG
MIAKVANKTFHPQPCLFVILIAIFLHTFKNHQIGGWAEFVHEDRLTHYHFMPDVLQLLQLGVHIESVKDQNDVRWEFGENAIAHLFISPQNLAKRNFSRVLYTWDCC